MKIRPLWMSKLAKDASLGGEIHPAGSDVFYIKEVSTRNLGTIIFTGPDPISLYLNRAEVALLSANKLLIEIRQGGKPMAFPPIAPAEKPKEVIQVEDEKCYGFLEDAFTAVIFMFSAIEAFTNQQIPLQAQYHIQTNGKVRTFNDKIALERECGTADKLTFLAEVRGKRKEIKGGKLWGNFIMIKALRDDLIHLKTAGEDSFRAYEKTYAQLFDADLSKMLALTVDLIESLRLPES